jgi:hypothetical protein
MRIDALLAQDRHFGAGGVDSRRRRCGGGHGVAGEVHVQAGVGRVTGGGVLGIGAGGVVALLADLPAHAVPDLVQVGQLRAEHGLGVAPDLQFALARVHRG